MAYTPDQVALAIINEGIRLKITPRGIQIALATAIVESGLRVLANPLDPASEALPNDGDGYDHASEGEFQQQPPWWGTVEQRMSTTGSADLFYAALVRLDYNNPNNSPGFYAQTVQQSAYPDRYDQEWQKAVDYYNRLIGQANGAPAPTPPPVPAPWFTEHNIIGQWAENWQDRAGQKPRLFVLHTSEGGAGMDLVNFMSGMDVSYHYVVNGNGEAWDLVDTDNAAWSVLDPANEFTINLVFGGSYAHWTRTDWLINCTEGIKVAAYLAVQDCVKYGIPIQLLVGNNYSRLPTTNGITDHYGIVVGLHIGNHVDVGPGFPWDVFNTYLLQFAAEVAQGDDMASVPQDEWETVKTFVAELHGALFNEIASQSIYRDSDSPVWKLHEMIKNDDRMTHQAEVERLAIAGVQRELGWVFKVAAGEGFDKSDYAMARAKSVLEQVPVALIQAYETALAGDPAIAAAAVNAK